MEPIYFYSNTKDIYKTLSNFYFSPIKINDKIYNTVEHYFQSQKFLDEAYSEKIRLATTPKQAKFLGSNIKVKLRDDWEKIKIDIMYKGLSQKFTQHEDLKKILLSTNPRNLVENSKYDSFWGQGSDGSGQNMLGKLLVKLRSEFLKSEK